MSDVPNRFGCVVAATKAISSHVVNELPDSYGHSLFNGVDSMAADLNDDVLMRCFRLHITY